MRNLLVRMIAVAIAAFSVYATPAMAQASRTWISGVGDDVNPCSRTAPCKTFAGAISKTAAGGEINVLDPGGFGGVVITKPITLKSDGDLGSILVSGQSGITVNISSATYPNARVVIQGLEFEGLNQTVGPGINGINVIAARDVIVLNVSIRGFPTGVCICGAEKARVTIDNSSLVSNGIGVLINNSTGQGSAKVSRSLFASNQTSSIQVSGAGNTVSISANQMYGSPKGLDLQSGGVATTFGNNSIGTSASDAAAPVPQS
ncbi:hypothetical protein [Sphingomonas bacterium]|uniref:hypothetical protein n=1 Tax=Sphingomonas bacterium TaxID=1895847 RepID=UPI00260559AE|nr:hypothetical protein [Sphingomonas bacterium]MDB5679270.1 hypothetical protein [Sphingomonas bacterium]